MRASSNPPRRAIARRRLAAVAIGVVLLLGAASGRAARLVDVRVGIHPGYVRVVLETDAPAAHEVVALKETEQVVFVYLAATSAPRLLPAREGAPSIEIGQTNHGTTVVRIQAPTAIRVETQVLAAPPRVVLDLRPAPQVETPPEPPVPDAPAEPRAEVPAPTPPAEPVAPPAPIAPAPEPVPAPAAEPPQAAPPYEPPRSGAPDETPVAVTVDASPEAVATNASLPTPTPEAVATPPAAEPLPAAAEPVEALPPVAAPPPVALALEWRSLATGIALGVALALVAFAARRPRAAETAAPVAAASAPAVGVESPIPDRPASAIAAEPDASPRDESAEDLRDFVRMHQRTDARLADVAARLGAVATRQDRLESQAGGWNAELASQRAAIARLKLALRPAGVVPRRNDRAETTSH